MNFQNKALLLLTATIMPMISVARSNPQVRINDYLESLKIWWSKLELMPVDILICENSGYDMHVVKDWILSVRAEDRITILQFNGDKSLVMKLGKGAGEAEMFDRCINENLISSYDYVIKCTGRLHVKNADELLKQIIQNNDDMAISIRGKLDFVDTRFFIIKGALFKTYLLNLGQEVDDSRGIYLEHIVLKRAFKAFSDGHKWGQFSALPRYIGVGGSDGKHHSSLLGAFRYFIKNSIHKLGVKFGIYWYL
ncbi:MAG TPA: hypothetical protein PL131_09600 [Methylotenera sp.]|nr:hypothetical protein [Methylotenera sp.]HPH06117.1 hypothetical protein [Methylotenera sp.]HPN00326.1 hypothetical protein [Methylotenera sp.]